MDGIDNDALLLEGDSQEALIYSVIARNEVTWRSGVR
jgi:hypothetical protein